MVNSLSHSGQLFVAVVNSLSHSGQLFVAVVSEGEAGEDRQMGWSGGQEHAGRHKQEGPAVF